MCNVTVSFPSPECYPAPSCGRTPFSSRWNDVYGAKSKKGSGNEVNRKRGCLKCIETKKVSKTKCVRSRVGNVTIRTNKILEKLFSQNGPVNK